MFIPPARLAKIGKAGRGISIVQGVKAGTASEKMKKLSELSSNTLKTTKQQVKELSAEQLRAVQDFANRLNRFNPFPQTMQPAMNGLNGAGNVRLVDEQIYRFGDNVGDVGRSGEGIVIIGTKGTNNNNPPAFKQPEFASSYESRLNQTPSPLNPKVEFDGIRGESLCTLKPPPDPDLKRILDKAGIEGIQYKNGVPDFSPVAKAQVEINYMLGGNSVYGGKARRANFTQSDQKLAEQLNNSPELAKQFGMESGTIRARDIKKYREINNFTWHELNDVKKMQLVPTKINSEFGHLGGVGEINAGAFGPGGFAKK